MKTVFMFPGQGSQSVGMMASLLEQFPVAREVFERASSAIDQDLTRIALEGPEAMINQTEITQPVVLTASIAMWTVWQEYTDFLPDYVCGHSLGEYSACVASEVFGFEEAVRLVHLRGKLMQQAVSLGEGGMAALLGLDDDAVVAVCAEAAQAEVVSAANFNSPGQVVISGGTAALQRAVSLAKEKGAKRATMLPVSVPCHCALLEPAGQTLKEQMDLIEFRQPLIPVVQNVNASIPANETQLRENLLQHLHQPVKWADSIRYLASLDAGVFVECGPGKVLSGLNKRISREVKTLQMNDYAGMQAVMDELGAERRSN